MLINMFLVEVARASSRPKFLQKHSTGLVCLILILNRNRQKFSIFASFLFDFWQISEA